MFDPDAIQIPDPYTDAEWRQTEGANMHAQLVHTETVARMPAGEYWVGDPCYAVPADRWMEWLEAAGYQTQDRYLLAHLDGKPVLGISTAHGDGCYPDDHGNEYPVDAGLIGLVPVEIAADNDAHHLEGMHRVRFDSDFECRYDEGVIVLGHIAINTSSCGSVEL